MRDNNNTNFKFYQYLIEKTDGDESVISKKRYSIENKRFKSKYDFESINKLKLLGIYWNHLREIHFTDICNINNIKIDTMT